MSGHNICFHRLVRIIIIFEVSLLILLSGVLQFVIVSVIEQKVMGLFQSFACV